jgi:outer membrane protein
MSRIGYIICAACLALTIAFGCFFYYKLPHTAYMRTEEVYNDFKLKKELEVKMNQVQEQRNRILDSLGRELEVLAQEIEVKQIQSGEKINRYNIVRRNYLMKKEDFEEQNRALSAKYSEQIWKQLNQFIKEFGEKNSYDYIFGVHGEGNLMYADEHENITLELKQYVNDKYEGNIK